MKTAIATLTVLLLATASAAAQINLSGHIRAKNGEELDGAIVRVYVSGRIKAFTTAVDAGKYALKINIPESDRDSMDVTVQCMGYEKCTATLPCRSARHDVVLKPDAIGLREVTVAAAAIREQGDTLSYNLASFIGKNDITLEDGLKKLPGVEVESSGKISYQGRAISRFYIEGMDMLGGKYNLATRTLPADYVTNVEIIDRHHDARVDKGTQSDQVALNIKLKRDVKFKPTGTSEAAAGYSDHLLGMISGTGMMFTPTFQTMLTVKAGNISEFASGLLTDHIVYYRRTPSNPAAEYLGSLSGSTPPLKSSRYINPTDYLVNVNAMKKSGDVSSLKASASYGYTDASYGYSETSSYFAGDREVVFNENNSPRSRTHKPSLDLNYTHNSDTRYFRNDLTAKAEFLRNDFLTLSDQRRIDQLMEKHTIAVADEISWRLKRDRLTWNFNAGASYNTAPTLRLTVSDSDGAGSIRQSLDGDVLAVNAEAGTSYTTGASRYSFHAEGKYFRTSASSTIDENPDAENRIIGHSGTVGIVPDWQYTSRNGRYEAYADLHTALNMLHARNRATGAKTDFDKLYFNPSLRFKYVFNVHANITLGARLNHSTGDAMELMTAPVMTSYRTSRVSSGIQARSRNFSSNLNFQYKLPLEYWWANAVVSYNDVHTNVLPSQDVSDSEIAAAGVARDNSTRGVSANASITKQIPSIKGKFTVSATYSLSNGETMQQSEIVKYRGNSYSISPNFSLTPVKLMEISYRGNFSKTTNRYLDVRDAFDVMSHNLKLTVNPIDRLSVFAEGEFMRRSISSDTRKNVAMFDLGARYRMRHLTFTLKADNLLNMRRYYYTTYNGLDTHTFSYDLRPRTFTLSVAYTL